MSTAEILSLIGSAGTLTALLVTLAMLVRRRSRHQKSPGTAHWDDPGLPRSGEERARAKGTAYLGGP